MVQYRGVCLCSLRNLWNSSAVLLDASRSRISELGYFDYEELALHGVDASAVPRGDVQHLQPPSVLRSAGRRRIIYWLRPQCAIHMPVRPRTDHKCIPRENGAVCREVFLVILCCMIASYSF